MQIKSDTDCYGMPLRVWQDAEGWCILQVGACFIPAKANENADLVIPHHILVAPDFDTAKWIVENAYKAAETQQAEASGAASIVCITGDCQRASMHGSLYCAEHRAEYE